MTRKAQALASLAAYLPEALLDRALTVAVAIWDYQAKILAFESLAARLPEALLDRALTAAEAIGDDWTKASAFVCLAERYRNYGDYSFMNRILDHLPKLRREPAIHLLEQVSVISNVDDSTAFLLINTILDISDRWK